MLRFPREIAHVLQRKRVATTEFQPEKLFLNFIPALNFRRFAHTVPATLLALPSISEIPFVDSWIPD